MEETYSGENVLKLVTTLKELFCQEKDKIIWDEVASRILKLPNTTTISSEPQSLSPITPISEFGDEKKENGISRSSSDVIVELTQLSRNINRKLSIFITEKQYEGIVWNVDLTTKSIYFLSCNLTDEKYGSEIGIWEDNKPNLKAEWKYLLKIK